MGVLLVERDGDVETVTINNPTKYNSLNPAGLLEFNTYFAQLRARYRRLTAPSPSRCPLDGRSVRYEVHLVDGPRLT